MYTMKKCKGLWVICDGKCGRCKADGMPTWSGNPACRRFEKINAGGGE